MSNQRRPPPPSKPTPPSGIRPDHPRGADLLQRVEALEKFIKEHFDEKNQWNSHVRDWVDKKVHIRLIDGTSEKGILRWMDRYTICIDEGVGDIAIVHKGAIAVIRLDDS